jgi:hypothetical protein
VIATQTARSTLVRQPGGSTGCFPTDDAFIVVYDHPRNRNLETALIVSVWDL